MGRYIGVVRQDPRNVSSPPWRPPSRCLATVYLGDVVLLCVAHTA